MKLLVQLNYLLNRYTSGISIKNLCIYHDGHNAQNLELWESDNNSNIYAYEEHSKACISCVTKHFDIRGKSEELHIVIGKNGHEYNFKLNFIDFEDHDEYFQDYKLDNQIINCHVMIIHDFNLLDWFYNKPNKLDFDKSPILIGHRGLGEDKVELSKENTIGGFNECAELGLKYCELDVLFNKHEEMVVYHDFFLDKEKQIENEIRFLSRYEINDKVHPNDVEKHIHNRLCPTLPEVLEEVNPNLGLFVELKFPLMTDNGHTENNVASKDSREYFFQKNKFVDKILQVLFDHVSKNPSRNIVLLSFSPDMCLLMHLKQSIWPVLQITRGKLNETGLNHVDIRMATIFGASSWAQFCGFSGIVTRFENVKEEEYLKLKKEQNDKSKQLLLFCYGKIPECMEIFEEARNLGITGLIVDNVHKFVQLNNTIY